MILFCFSFHCLLTTPLQVQLSSYIRASRPTLWLCLPRSKDSRICYRTQTTYSFASSPFAASLYDPTPLPTHLLRQRLTPRLLSIYLFTRLSPYLIQLYVPSVST